MFTNRFWVETPTSPVRHFGGFWRRPTRICFGPDLLPRGIEQLAGSVRYRWSLDEDEDLLKFLAANCNHASVQAPRDTDAGAAGAVGSALPLRPQQAEKSPDTFLVHDSLLREFTAVGDFDLRPRTTGG